MTTATLATAEKTRDAFFSARATMQTIETLWELATYAERPFGGDTEDLTPAACCMADAEGWDLNGLRDRLGEDVTEYARELPLSVLVRSDWHHPMGESTYSEFEILLSTGGPAVRVLGDLDSYLEPYRPGLQFSDWGVDWTDHPSQTVTLCCGLLGCFTLGSDPLRFYVFASPGSRQSQPVRSYRLANP
jgi:hypothetical protein